VQFAAEGLRPNAMLFNSLEFFAFFLVVYCLYLILPHRGQNGMLLAASYVFYGAWDWRFLFLILFSTLVDYFSGLGIAADRNHFRRKIFLWISIITNLGLLGFFKYFNFFTESLIALGHQFGLSLASPALNIILPVGISFYTFQTMSYTIDIYRGSVKPTKNFPDFALYVAFFPQLVAGPIERASRLLPQILLPRNISAEKIGNGCALVMWGYFLKVFVADNVAPFANEVFAAAPPYHTAQVLTGVYAFAFQIFCDFAGYSSIAQGIALLMGIELMTNFSRPYFTTNPRDFWARWHISLSTWLRDYLYIPLGGNQGGHFMLYRNLFLTMLLGGLWHGAAWTFIVWGAYQGLLLILHRAGKPIWDRVGMIGQRLTGMAWRPILVIFFFQLICLGWIFFRAQSLSQAGSLIAGFFHFEAAGFLEYAVKMSKLSLFILPLLIVHLAQAVFAGVNFKTNLGWVPRGMVYFTVIALTVIFGSGGGRSFIYFQF